MAKLDPEMFMITEEANRKRREALRKLEKTELGLRTGGEAVNYIREKLEREAAQHEQTV